MGLREFILALEKEIKYKQNSLNRWHLVFKYTWFRVALIFFTMFLISSLSTNGFLSKVNLQNLFRQASIIGIVAIGMTLVIICRNIDLSVGSMVAFVATISMLLQGTLNNISIILISIVVGVTLGLINGVFIGYLGFDSFLITLSTWMIYRGMCFVLTGGRRFTKIGPGYGVLGKSNIEGIPVIVIIFITLVIIMEIFLNRTTFGRSLRYIGGNETAAFYSGIKVWLIKTISFVINGFFCGIAAVIFTSRYQVVYPLTTADGFEFTAIASVILGGTTLIGGRGSVIGTFFGVMILSLIQNELNLLGISPYYHRLITGIIIVLAVVFQHIQIRKKFNE